jgi:hypothetical protein
VGTLGDPADHCGTVGGAGGALRLGNMTGRQQGERQGKETGTESGTKRRRRIDRGSDLA